jgi:hypothetical protein
MLFPSGKASLSSPAWRLTERRAGLFGHGLARIAGYTQKPLATSCGMCAGWEARETPGASGGGAVHRPRGTGGHAPSSHGLQPRRGLKAVIPPVQHNAGFAARNGSRRRLGFRATLAQHGQTLRRHFARVERLLIDGERDLRRMPATICHDAVGHAGESINYARHF